MLRNILLASLAATAAVAQKNSVCSDTVNISVQSDLDSIASCTKITGDVNINTELVNVELPSLQSIAGNLNVGGVLMMSLSAPLLNSITGQFNMTELTVLGSLSFPSLTTVGSIYWKTLPALSGLSFAATITSADNVYISDTRLASLEGINLMTVGTFDINNNRQLTQVNVQLANVTNSLSINFNGQGVVASFPNLIWANNATFQDCKAVTMPSLKSVNGSLGFINNTITTFSAANLTSVGQAVAFVDNTALTNISMPQLVSVGGSLQLANNSMLLDIDGFKSLKTIGGAIDFSGSFTNATLPSLTDVKGGFNLQTTKEFDCSTFDAQKGNVIEGNSYVCEGAVVNPGTQGTTPTTTSSGSPSATSKGAAVENVASSFGIFAAAAIVGALVL